MKAGSQTEKTKKPLQADTLEPNGQPSSGELIDTPPSLIVDPPPSRVEPSSEEPPSQEPPQKTQPQYYQLVWGIENCIDGQEDKTVINGSDSLHSPCLGDCDDAFILLFGELNLKYKDGKISIVSHKNQNVSFTTYSGTWTFWKPKNAIKASESHLIVKIINKSGNVESQKKLNLHTENQATQLDPFIDPQSITQVENIYVKEGYLIDISAEFGGDDIGTDECPRSSSQLTGNPSYGEAYFLRQTSCDDPNLSEKDKEFGGMHKDIQTWCCSENSWCSIGPDPNALFIEGRNFADP